MEIETIRELQAYGYILMIILLTVGLYAYIHHLYKTQREGKRDYEKYSNLALDDSLDSSPIEQYTKKEKNEEGANR